MNTTDKYSLLVELGDMVSRLNGLLEQIEEKEYELTEAETSYAVKGLTDAADDLGFLTIRLEMGDD